MTIPAPPTTRDTTMTTITSLGLTPDSTLVVLDAVTTHAEVDIRAALRDLAPHADHLPVAELDAVLSGLFGAAADRWVRWDAVTTAYGAWHRAHTAREPDETDLRLAYALTVENIARGAAQ